MYYFRQIIDPTAIAAFCNKTASAANESLLRALATRPTMVHTAHDPSANQVAQSAMVDGMARTAPNVVINQASLTPAPAADAAADAAAAATGVLPRHTEAELAGYPARGQQQAAQQAARPRYGPARVKERLYAVGDAYKAFAIHKLLLDLQLEAEPLATKEQVRKRNIELEALLRANIDNAEAVYAAIVKAAAAEAAAAEAAAAEVASAVTAAAAEVAPSTDAAADAAADAFAAATWVLHMHTKEERAADLARCDMHAALQAARPPYCPTRIQERRLAVGDAHKAFVINQIMLAERLARETIERKAETSWYNGRLLKRLRENIDQADANYAAILKGAAAEVASVVAAAAAEVASAVTAPCLSASDETTAHRNSTGATTETGRQPPKRRKRKRG
jgi:hypothetical protein